VKDIIANVDVSTWNVDKVWLFDASVICFYGIKNASIKV